MLIVGLGAAGVAVTKILMEAGVHEHHRLRLPAARCTPSAPTTSTARCTPIKRWFAEPTNPEGATARPPT